MYEWNQYCSLIRERLRVRQAYFRRHYSNIKSEEWGKEIKIYSTSWEIRGMIKHQNLVDDARNFTIQHKNPIWDFRTHSKTTKNLRSDK